MKNIKKILHISRPRFWIYTCGPCLIGLVASIQSGNLKVNAMLILWFIYFTFPANLLIYGINDIFDYETDKLNNKKLKYESLVHPKEQKKLFLWIISSQIPFFIAFYILSLPKIISILWAGFLFFSIFYSSPPIRAKTKPLMDSFFNVLYIFPGLIIFALNGSIFNLAAIIAAILWVMAMHAYSAIPDIKADKNARIKTIATWLGAHTTLIFCLICYIIAAYLTFPILGITSIILSCLYIILLLISKQALKQQKIFQVYTYFPYINTLCGMAIFFFFLFQSM